MSKTITKEFLNGVNQALNSLEITLTSNGAITSADIAFERNHWASQPIAEPTSRDIANLEIESKSKELKAFNALLNTINKNIKDFNTGIADLGLEVVKK